MSTFTSRARTRRPAHLLAKTTALLVTASLCAIVPSEAASAKTPVRQITKITAAGIPGATGTTVATSVRVKNTTGKRRPAAHALLFLVGDDHVFGLGKVLVPAMRPKARATATVKRKATLRAPAGRYAVRACFVSDPDRCRTSAKTVQIAPARLTASPTALAFADTLVGTTSPSQRVLVTNTGQSRSAPVTATVRSTSFDLTGSTCGASLAPGATCTATAAFGPDAAGAAAGTLEVTDRRGIGASIALAGTGLAPPVPSQPAALSMAPGEILFGTTTIGESTAAQTITLTNDGDLTSGTPTITATGDDDQFDITDDTCDAALAGGESCTVDVAFSPTASGQSTALLTAAATPGGEVSTELNGTGQTPPALSISETSHDYGYSDDPDEHSFTITNTGDVSTGVPDTAVVGDAAFSIDTDTCASALPSGASCSVGVTYTGTGTVEQSARLDVAATSGGTVSADLTGSPVALSVTPAGREFGEVDVDATSDEESFVLTNHRLTSVQLEEDIAGPFTVNDSCDGTTVVAGGTCAFTVAFSPTAAGPASGSITYQSGADSIQVALTGYGTTAAALSVTASNADFGAWEVGGAPGSSDLTITNTGTETTDAVTVELQGADTTNFSVDADDCPAVLAGGASCTATIEFAPLSFGDKTATVAVGGAPSTPVDLIGLGAPAGVSLFPATYDYGSVAVGDAGYKTFRVVNTTENGEDMNSASSGPPFPFELNQDFTCVLVISTIQPHRWCTMTVSFKPQSVGSFNTTLTAGGTNFNISSQLLGTGTPSAARLRGGRPEPVGPYTLGIEDGEPITR